MNGDYCNYLTDKTQKFNCIIEDDRCKDCIAILRLLNPKHLVDLVTFLKEDASLDFVILIDICGVDYLDRAQRFDVVYNFLSIRHNKRLRLKIGIEDDQSLESLSKIFKAASWYECEVYDMYGINFLQHPNLRRILTDYDFHGHPLRKDFPLSGTTQVRYDVEAQQVVSEPVQLMQEYRDFNFTSPWNKGQNKDSIQEIASEAVGHLPKEQK